MSGAVGRPQGFELIPAIDVLGGRCVRLAQGDYERATVYREDPAEQAAAFADVGCDMIVVAITPPHDPALLEPLADALAPLR